MIRNRASFVKCAPMLAALCLAIAPVRAEEPALDSQPTNTLAEGILVSDGHLTINVDNIDITQLLRMLSVKRRVSIVAGPRVSGAVSLNLYDVTFEEALRAILDVSACTATYKGDVILVTGASEKGLLPLDTADLHVKVFKLDYLDPNEALTIVQQFISPAGRVVASNIEYTLLVEDTLAYVERISSLVEQIDVPPKQVLIEATLLEIIHDDDLTFGVELGVTQINGNTIFRALTSGFAQDVTALPETAQGLFAGILTEDTETFIEALAEVGNVKMLAHPKILAVNRQRAQIIIGERLGFRITTTTETSSLESVEFLEVGTQLALTPRISNDGTTVLLDITPKVSDGSVSVLGLPSERTAEATTFMLVKDGQTVVLGGLIQERTSDQVAKVPLLGDIPFLGHLFRKTTKSETVHELVVLITPHIMGPEPDDAMRETIANVEEMATPSENTLYGEREKSPHTVRTPPFRPRSALAHAEEPSEMTAEPAPADLEGATSAPLVQPRLEEAAHVATADELAETPSSALETPGYEVDEAAASSFADVAQSLFGANEDAPGTALEEPESPVTEQGKYSVQVLAARNETIAGDYVASLQQDGLPAWVKPPDLTAGDEWYRAMIGRFSTRAHAKEKLKNLQHGDVFSDAFVANHASENASEKDGLVVHARANTETRRSSRQTHDGRKEGL